jgi:putative transposase
MSLHLPPGTPVIINDVQFDVSHWTTDGRIVIQNRSTGACDNYSSSDLSRMFAARQLQLHEKKAESGVFNPQFAEFGLLSEAKKQIAYDRLSHLLAVKKYSRNFSRPVVARITDEVQQAICKREQEKAEKAGTPFDEEKWSLPPSYSSIRRWDKMWEASHDIRALVPNFHLRGGHGPKLNILIHSYIDLAIQQKWLRKPRKSQETVYETAIKLIADYNKARPSHEHLTLPCKKTVQRSIAAEDQKTVMAARYSKKEANAEFHNYGHLPVADYPHQLVMLDDTVLDLSIVDNKYRTALGRPHLTCVIDVYSRMVLGFFVSFAPPSADTAMMALRHAILDKSYIATQYPMIQSDWPATGRIQNLLTDNHSSFKKRSFMDAMAGLGIVQHFGPKGKSWVRAHIERWFGTVTTSLVQQLPGTHYSNIKRKGKDQPTEHAAMTLSEFIRCLHIWVVDYYNKDVNTGLVGIPYEVYLNGVKRVPTKMHSALEDLDCLLFSGDRVKLDRQGIEFENLQYNSEQLTMLRRRGDAPEYVDIRYNPMDIREIWVLDPNTLSFFTVPACDVDYTSEIRTLDHHKAIHSYGLLKAEEKKDVVRLAEVRAMVEDLADESVRKTTAARQAGKRVARLREAAAASEAAVRSETATKVIAQASAPDLVANENADEDVAAPQSDNGEQAVRIDAAVNKPQRDVFVPNFNRVQISRKDSSNV